MGDRNILPEALTEALRESCSSYLKFFDSSSFGLEEGRFLSAVILYFACELSVGMKTNCFLSFMSSAGYILLFSFTFFRICVNKFYSWLVNYYMKRLDEIRWFEVFKYLQNEWVLLKLKPGKDFQSVPALIWFFFFVNWVNRLCKNTNFENLHDFQAWVLSRAVISVLSTALKFKLLVNQWNYPPTVNANLKW